MILFPNAKINIGLNIIEKRPDGFHNIESVFYPVGLRDVLEVIQDFDADSQGITCNFSGIEIPGVSTNNLCVKAYHLIAQDYALPPVKIHLHKIISIGAGLGGGSSDAAFFIKAMDELFQLNISWGEKHHYARQVGSDCSFFITNRPAFAEGKGDSLEPTSLDLKGYYLVIINPGIHINTAEAYAGVLPQKPGIPLEELIVTLPIDQWKDNIRNDFENPVFIKHPGIKKIKENLYNYGAIYASMSGSGSSVYGIFKEQTKLVDKFKDCFVWEGNF